MVTTTLGKARDVWGMMDMMYQTSMATAKEMSSQTFDGIRLARDFFFCSILFAPSYD